VKNLTDEKFSYLRSMFSTVQVAVLAKYLKYFGTKVFFFFKDIVGLTLSYLSKINAAFCPQRVSWPLKGRCDVFSGVDAVHPVGCDSPLQIVMAVWCTFLRFELAGSGVAACCRL
jgi:hypothetical protein